MSDAPRYLFRQTTSRHIVACNACRTGQLTRQMAVWHAKRHVADGEARFISNNSHCSVEFRYALPRAG